MKKTSLAVYGLLALCVLAACATPRDLDEEQLGRLRNVEVAIDVPEDNFVYQGVDTAKNMPYVAPPSGVSVGTALAANFFVGIVVASIDNVLNEAASRDAQPVGQSVRNLDLRAMAFGQLKDMSTAAARASTLTLSARPFPRVEEPPPIAHNQPVMNPYMGRITLDPLKAMAEHAAASSADATLFVKVLPLFTLEARTAPVVHSAAWLFDRSGQLLHTSTVAFVGALPPPLERGQMVSWWADGHYRRLIAQGVRAVMLPLGEDMTQPGLAAQRRAAMKSASATLKADVAKPDSTQQGSAITRAQESAANVARMRSSACIVDSDGPPLIYRYERFGHNELLVVSAYCHGETLDLWNQALVPGMSWLREQSSAPRSVEGKR